MRSGAAVEAAAELLLPLPPVGRVAAPLRPNGAAAVAAAAGGGGGGAADWLLHPHCCCSTLRASTNCSSPSMAALPAQAHAT